MFNTSGSTRNSAIVLYDKQNSAVTVFRTFARKEDFKAFMKKGKRTTGVFANYGFNCGRETITSLV